MEDSQSLRDEENNIISDLQGDSVGSASSNQWVGRAQNSIGARTKPIIKIGTDKNNLQFTVWGALISRAYTTGDMTMLGILRPAAALNLHDRVRLIAGYSLTERFNDEKSPVGFDQIVEGTSSVFGDASILLTDWLSIGGHVFYSLSRSEFVSQETRLIIGPQDLKLMIGYDPVFKRVNAGININFAGPLHFRRMTYESRVKNN